MILVGHDMGLMAQFADRIGVMYAGKLVELATVEQIFSNPRHPYTRLLISSLPDTAGKRRLEGIPGLPPSLLEIPPGCPFMPRCPEAMDICGVDVPELLGEVDMVSCHLHTEARNRMTVTAETTTPTSTTNGASSSLLELRNVTQIFSSGPFWNREHNYAVNDVSFNLTDKPALITAGCSGRAASGKTTLGRIMLGFQRPTLGQVLFRGDDVAEMNAAGTEAVPDGKSKPYSKTPSPSTTPSTKSTTSSQWRSLGTNSRLRATKLGT